KLMRRVIRENRLAIFCTNSEENNDRCVVPFIYRRMHRMLSTDFVHNGGTTSVSSHYYHRNTFSSIIPGRDRARPSTQPRISVSGTTSVSSELCELSPKTSDAL